MKKIKRRKKQKDETELLLERFTTLLFLVRQYFRDQEIPNNWGLNSAKKVSEKELKIFLKKHGGIKSLKKKKWSNY